MSRNEELIGVWNGADYVFDNGDDRRCVIGSLRLLNREQTTLRGYAAEHELIGGVTYRFYGHFRNHPKHGRQFAFNSFVEEAPVDEDSVLAYLTQCRKPERGSITDRVARALFEEFGLESISKLIADPVGAAMNVKQWGAEKAAIASEYLRTQEGTRNCKLALIGILDGRGFPKKTVDRAIKEWGAAAAKVVKTDPYELMKLPGIGFKGADKLYCDLSREAAKTDEEYQQALGSMKRQGLCVAYYVNTESRQSGDTWVSIGMAKAAVSRLISSTHAKPNEAIEWAVLNGRLVVRDAFCANARMALHELEIAEFMTGSEDGNEWPDIDLIREMASEDKQLSQHQLDAISVATSQRVGCLQGSPGVGKTVSAACIAKAVIRKYGEDSIGLAAPTGKAGVRMSQALAANGVKVPASTIHRLLGVEGQEGDGWRFHYNDQNPLPFRFMVIDEMSMTDVDLLASLLRACTPSMHLLFIGDSNQLAPVGHGRPFYDLQSCIPTGHLTEIRRNSGKIVEACAEIRDRNTISFSPQISLPADNLTLIAAADEQQVQVLEDVIGIIGNNDGDTIEDLQIVTGKNDGSEVARKPLNKMLQKLFNANGHCMHGNPFRVGDKIVCLKNGTYPDAEEQTDEHFVANGELGRVIEIHPGRMTVRLSDPVREIKIIHAPVQENERDVADSEDSQRGAVGDWDLGYALSVHRSQGSQWKYVIVMADSKGGMVQTRNWIYTAISRAEIATWVIGQRQVVNQMMRRDGISNRKTFLVARINEQRGLVSVDFDELFAEV